MDILLADNTGNNTCLKRLRTSFRRATTVNIAVAFLKQSGFNLVKNDFLKISNKGSVELIVGLDFKSTEPRTLKELLKYSKDFNIKCYCFSDYLSAGIPVFHPKLYYVEQKGNTATAIIGSSNLTRGGLQDNYEINVVFRGRVKEPYFKEIQTLYRRIKLKESVFMPDLEFIDGYKEVYNRVKKNTRKAIKEPATLSAVKTLKKKETRLPRAYPTQKQLVMQVIMQLPKDNNGYVHLKSIQKYVREKALNLKIPFDFNTLDNSVRGRLNEHSLGKGGEDLFERFGSRKGGTGLYKLTQKASRYFRKPSK
jgi:HKD family nuclease